MRILLRNYQSPGDTLMLTAAASCLKQARPSWEIYVSTPDPALWRFNASVRGFLYDAECSAVKFDKVVNCEYPSIHESNESGKHFVTGFTEHLSGVLGFHIPQTQWTGRLLRPWEYALGPKEVDHLQQYWVVFAGGKYDFTAKWWPHDHWQTLVKDMRRSGIPVVQAGASEHYHPHLTHANINLVGKTDLDGLIHLLTGAQGVVCPVTFAHHAMAAIAGHGRYNAHKGLVTIAGGREPSTWEDYTPLVHAGAVTPFLHARYHGPKKEYSCCGPIGGCWKSRTVALGDDSEQNASLCKLPVINTATNDPAAPQCLVDITPGMVLESVLSVRREIMDA